MAVTRAVAFRCARCAVVVALALAARPGAAQEPRREPVLEVTQLQQLANEVNGQSAFKTMSMVATYHRMLGSDELSELMTRLESAAKGYGIPEVTVHRVPVKTGRETFWLQDFGGQVPATTRGAELRLVRPSAKLIVAADGVPSMVVQGSRAADVTAAVVFVGRGTEAKDYEGRAVAGKIVLAGNAPIDAIKEMAIHRHGAAGVLYYRDTPSYSGSDMDANLGLWWWPWGENGEPSTFGISLSTNQYRELKALLDRKEEVVVHAKVDATVKTGADAVFETLDLAIPGTSAPREEFWIVAHIDHPYPGAVDNASGVAVVLETARTLQALIRNGITPPPQRTIRFLLVPHVAGLSMYLSQHPEKLGRVRGAISIDGVGIDRTQFSSYFAVYKPSHALASYWTAVVESLVAHVEARTNRDPMDWDNVDNLFAPEGSRDQFHMRLERYTGGGDEFQLNQGNVGIPAIAFGSAPVPPRHSQVNGTRWIDPTGLRRASYLAAALATTFGWTDSTNIHRVIDETYHRGRGHLVQALARAAPALARAPDAERPAARRRGDSLIREIGAREVEALTSIRALAGGGHADAAAMDLIQNRITLMTAATRLLRDELAAEHARICRAARCAASPAPLTDLERQLQGLTPVPAPGVHGSTSYFGDYFGKRLGRERLASFKLRPGFDYSQIAFAEARNFVDGKRSALEIYEAVQAELWFEGYPASQTISLHEYHSYLQMLDASGLIELRSARAGSR